MNFADNPDFYPTPSKLIRKMLKKVDALSSCNEVLEPSAGAGHIIDYLKEEYSGRRMRVSAIEKDPRLQKMLVGNEVRLIDSDFLLYEGTEQFDLLVANFPFSNGEQHLLKAIDVIYSGQIVCLINAETIKNPNTQARKYLMTELSRLGADIEFLAGEFSNGERKTAVECALIYIDKRIEVEEDLFSSMKEEGQDDFENVDRFDITQKEGISGLVKNYNLEKKNVIDQIISFYRNYNLVSQHLDLSIVGDKDSYFGGDSLTEVMKQQINTFTRKLKKEYWRKALELKEVKRYLSSHKRKVVEVQIEQFSGMEFTENNIRQFILNLIELFPEMITGAIEYLFDEFTKFALKDCHWGESEFKNSIHYFNGWKSNSAFCINQKVIRPFHMGRYSYDNEIKIGYDHEDFFNDLDVVMSYFTGNSPEFESYELCKAAIDEGQNRKIMTPFFEISIFKKGTIHLKFRSAELCRKFNIEACRLKKWLPMDYGTKSWTDLEKEDQELVKSFEGQKNYSVVDKAGSLVEGIKAKLPLLLEAS